MAEVAVVGAGQSGLGVACGLAERDVSVTLVERLPAAGGQEPEGAPEARLLAAAQTAGVRLMPATFAVRWQPGALVVLGPDGPGELVVDALVVATGTRPATRGELGIAGDRCAGILPGSAALHLTQSGVLLGHDPVVYGGGTLAATCAELLHAAGARSVTVIAPVPPVAELPSQTRVLAGWEIAAAHGVARVSAITIEHGGQRERLATDALILAEGRIPMRNVEGAVLDGPQIVACHSAGEPKSAHDAAETARRAVDQTLALLAGNVLAPIHQEV